MSTKMKVMKVMSAQSSFMYYLSDNIVWFSKIGFMNKEVPFSRWFFSRGLKWGQLKDGFSLAKTVLELIIFLYTYVLKQREEKLLVEKLN